MTTQTPFQDAFLATFKLFRDEGIAPTKSEREAYEKGESYHGVFGVEKDEEVVETAFLVAMTWAMVEKKPLPFFLPKTVGLWSQDRIRILCKSAFVRHPNCKPLVIDALRHVQTQQPPWAFKNEPGRWVMFGFDKAWPILPAWFLSQE